jgi:hypothetical protein
MTIERKDLVAAVLISRDELDPDLETELLEAVVHSEAGAAGDGEAALRAIDAEVTAAIARGVGYLRAVASAAEANDEGENEEEGA